MRNKPILIMLFAIMIIPLAVIIILGRKREHYLWECMTPDEIEALRRYQAITDIVCPDGEWEDDYSWVQ